MGRKALVVGIDFYENGNNLHGCINDSYSVKAVLERNSDSTINFDIKHKTASDVNSMIERIELKNDVMELFKDDSEIALFYFSGHGHIEFTGGYLITSECKHGDDGLPLNDLIKIANDSPAKNKVIIIDSCHSGFTGKVDSSDKRSFISEGLTILTASSEDQYALEENGTGVFTKLLVDALNGSAANLIGEISPGGIYAHIDQSLGAWEQRPIFKTNVKKFNVLRHVKPSISLEDLRKITIYFPNKDSFFQLDPSFEPERSGDEDSSFPKPTAQNIEIFSVLQKFNRVNMVVPVNAPHMWHAAINSKGCKLTVLGEHYWNLVNKGRI